MSISELYRCPCGDWQATPRWLFWKLPYRRALYAWWNIGGGFDGWEYGRGPALTSQNRQP